MLENNEAAAAGTAHGSQDGSTVGSANSTADLVRAALAARGCTAKALAVELGISATHLSNAKAGRYALAPSVQATLAGMAADSAKNADIGSATATPATPATQNERAKRLAEAERFLSALDTEAAAWTFQTFDDGGRRGELARTIDGELAAVFDQLDALNRRGAGVFVTVNETDGQGRKAENITRVRAVFADFDPPKTRSAPASYQVEPVIEVESSPGRRHVYWTVDDLALEDFEAQQRGIVAALGCDSAPVDLPRVMRLPGFRHQKDPSKPHWVRIISAEQRLPYQAAELARAFPPVAKVNGSGKATGEKPDTDAALAGASFFAKTNRKALASPGKWFPALFPTARNYHDGYRVASTDLGRALEEDISILSTGAWDFGEERGVSPVDLVVQWGPANNAKEAALWLCERLGIDPATLGWRGSSEGATAWPEPEALPDGLPPVDPFDPAMLPEALRPWLSDVAERMQCPPEFPAVAAVACLAAVCGRQVGIRPKRHDDWLVVPNLWSAVIGRPSLLKSPALAEPMRMVDALEAKAADFYREELREHNASARVEAINAKLADQDIQKALKAGDKSKALGMALDAASDDEPPKRRRYRTSDATIEKLGELLRDNPRGILLFRDELTGFLRSLDKEGREGSRAFFLEAWNGTGSFTFDRIGRGTVEIDAACVSILGAIQPGPLTAYLTETLRGGAGDDGLLQRFQLAVYPDAPKDWRNVDRPPDPQARQVARALFERLDTIDPAGIRASFEDGDRIPWLRFDAQAQELFDDWRADLEQRLRTEDLPPVLEAHLAKYRSLAPSLALLFHLADDAQGGTVGKPSLLRALAWCEYLETHARRIFAPALEPELFAALELDKRLLELPEPFTAKDIYRNHWRGLDRQGTTEALALLEDYGRIRGEKSDGPGRPTLRYRVNPALREAG